MVYKNKTYIAFDGDNDMRYYNLMRAWKNNKNINFNFYNAHDLNTARDSSLELSIKSQLRKRFEDTKILILLVGESTYRLTKFVKWEIDTAKMLNIPIVLVSLNKNNKLPNWFIDYPVLQVPFIQNSIEFALENWLTGFNEHQKRHDIGIWYYKHDEKNL